MKLITALALAFASIAAAHPTSDAGPSCGVDVELATRLGAQGILNSNSAGEDCPKFLGRIIDQLYSKAEMNPDRQDELYGLAGWAEALRG